MTVEEVGIGHATLSGNRPGIQRTANAAGNARRSGAREFSETDHPLLDQCRHYPTRLTLTGAHDCVGLAARQFSAVEHRFEDAARLGGQRPRRISSSAHISMRARKRSG